MSTSLLMIAVAVITGFIALAKRGRGRGRRKMGRYIRGNVDETMDLGTLAARTLQAEAFDEAVNERTFISSLVASWSLGDMTDADDVGPIMVGVAHGDYSAAEIEEFIENTGSWDEGDLVQQEVGQRKIRVVGIFETAPAASVVAVRTLNEGRPIKTKLGWILLQAQTIDVWAYNLGSAALSTTAPNLHLQGHVNLWPR